MLVFPLSLMGMGRFLVWKKKSNNFERKQHMLGQKEILYKFEGNK
jgi:hypothetical protein